MPAIIRCNACGREIEIAYLLRDGLICRHCTSDQVTLVSGQQCHVKFMEVA